MFRWLRPLLRREQFERELEAELLFHLEQQTRAHMASGVSEAEARRRARLDLGGVTQAQEETRMARRASIFFEFGQDLRYGWRVMRKNSGLTAIAIASLAIGIGANTAIFSVFHSVLVRDLPYADPKGLVAVGLQDRKGNGGMSDSASPVFFQQWRYAVGGFAGTAALHETYEVNLTGDGRPERLDTQLVTGEFFRLLGVNPLMGRYLTPDDDQPGHQMVAVLSYALWAQRFGARQDIVGRRIELDTRPYTVVGVMPRGFQFLNPNAALWRPFGWGPGGDKSRTFYLRAFARLKPGVTVGQAHGELAALYAAFGKSYDARLFESTMLSAEPLQSQFTGNLKQPMVLLLCGVGFVLLIACANVANLLLSRAAARQAEMSVRAALGASRGRLARQHLTESVALSLAGCVLGVLLAVAAVPGLVRLMPAEFPRRAEIGIDLTVLAVSVGLSIVTGLIFGMFPAWAASHSQANSAGHASGMRLQGGRFSNRARQALAVVQVAAALLLLTGCGLMMRTFWALEHTSLGFDAKSVYTFQVRLARERYTSRANDQAAIDPNLAVAFDRVLERLRMLPGVSSAAAVTWLPMNGFWSENRGLQVEGRAPAPNERNPWTGYNPVSTDFFHTFRIRLVRGRDFNEHDTEGSRWVAIVNQRAARTYWKNEDPIGSHIRIDLDDRPREVIGIVEDVKHYEVQEGSNQQVYVPHAQQAPVYPWNRVRGRTHMSFAVRSDSRENWEADFRAATGSVDKDMPVYAIWPMRHYVAETEGQQRLYLMLLTIFAGAALTLAAIGVYGVINYSVARRTQEIGVRMAMGARPGDAVRMVLGEGVVVAVCGLAAGFGLAYWLTRFLRSYLFGVTATDLPTFLAVAGCLIAIIFAASYLPARRASRIDPISALRHE